jgi:sialate O-acetylesterase
MGMSAVDNVTMAVTIDVGEYNDLHPQDKKSVGERMALGARKIAYGEHIVYSGPIYREMKREGNKIRLYFDHVGGGLVARGGEELGGFVIRGSDGDFVPARAVIDGETVVVSHERISEPLHVRYAWADNPLRANLYNREGLPASPFTTEPYDATL